jgi:hypothetical protein
MGQTGVPAGATGSSTLGAPAASDPGSSAPACGDHALKTTEGGGGAAMSHQDAILIFTNVSTHRCTLQGYPGAAIVDRSTVLVNAARTLSGYIGDAGVEPTGTPLVTLAPGASASAVLEWDANAGEVCYPNGAGALEVTAPNTTATVSLRSARVGSEGICAGLVVHPVIAGIISN